MQFGEIGYFDTALEAAKVYDAAAFKEHRQFAILNGALDIS